MRPTFRKLEVKDIGNLERLVAENVEGIEPGLKIVDSRLLLGQAAIDLVGLDSKGSLVLIALDFNADEGLLLRVMDAYSWCIEYPDTLRRLYPMAKVTTSQPPRILFIVERLADSFRRRIKQLSFLEIDCFEFRHLEVNGAAVVYFDLVERLRKSGVESALAAPADAPRAAPARPMWVEPAPAIVDPVRAEPRHAEPARVEPVKVEPARVEPVREPVRVEPVKAEPVRVEPVRVEAARPEVVAPARVEPLIIGAGAPAREPAPAVVVAPPPPPAAKPVAEPVAVVPPAPVVPPVPVAPAPVVVIEPEPQPVAPPALLFQAIEATASQAVAEVAVHGASEVVAPRAVDAAPAIVIPESFPAEAVAPATPAELAAPAAPEMPAEAPSVFTPPAQTPVWAKPQTPPNGGGRPYFFAQATKGNSPAEVPAAPAAAAAAMVEPPAQPAATKVALEVDDRPELESLSFPKDGLSRQWLEFLSQLGATK